ncbi:MAG: hypothetical protein HQL46_11930 [Gammaproteobacteria bacterium]|nr:hypothetical protein [Gammaproteobacteria bacterium]
MHFFTTNIDLITILIRGESSRGSLYKKIIKRTIDILDLPYEIMKVEKITRDKVEYTDIILSLLGSR